MKINLWQPDNIPYLDLGADTPNSMETFFVTTYFPLPCVVVLPGGGYSLRAPHEGAPIAKFFNSRGMHAVVVDYRVKPNEYPAPLADAQRAIKLLRANAKEWKIDPDKIIVLGFSAGGHLAAACSTLPDVTADRIGADEVDKMSAKPNGAVLCYPAVSFDEDYGNPACGVNLLGRERAERQNGYFTLKKHITEDTPPTFIWHTSEDRTVNITVSLEYGEALRAKKVPFEMHVFPHGPHGLGLPLNDRVNGQWGDMAADWIINNI